MKTAHVIILAALNVAIAFSTASKATAHCDTLDGPVVADAKLALTKGDVTPVLKWVDKKSEKEVREAFAATRKVRVVGGDAERLADLHFFETVVRVHRAGEGEPFTGLKPAGTIDPAFQAADRALSDGEIDQLAAELAKAVEEGARERFAAVVAKKKHAEESVEAGRAYVAAYIKYAHFIEAIHTISSPGAEGQHHLHATDEQAK